VCHSLRRSGKTSLLYRIETRGFTDPRLRPVYVDMQGVDEKSKKGARQEYKKTLKFDCHKTPGIKIGKNRFK
jgi:hypothetical protein